MRIKSWAFFFVIFSASSILPVWAESIPAELPLCVDITDSANHHIAAIGPCWQLTPVAGVTRTDAMLSYISDGKDFYTGPTPIQKDDDIERIVVVVHGAGGGDVTGIHKAVVGDIRDSSLGIPALQRSEVWVVAPRFQPEGNYLRWGTEEGSGYSVGDVSTSPTVPVAIRISSFELVDVLIEAMKARSNAQNIVVMGFSGGGKFVNRYSIGTDIDQTGPTFGYVVASPSSYLYLNDNRPVAPPDQTTCTEPGLGYIEGEGYNKYPYGLSEIPAGHYMKHLDGYTRAQIKARIATKHRLFLIGTSDTVVEESFVCAELAQGESRFLRAKPYWNHLKRLEVATNAAYCEVDGVGHQGGKMLGSKQAEQFWKTFSFYTGCLTPPID